jgi:nucleotide-binding universal stress UspA family protein
MATSRVTPEDEVGIERGSGAKVEAVRYRQVLVPLDGSALGAHALPTARALADRFGAEVQSIGIARNDAEADEMREHAIGGLGGLDAEDRVTVVVADDPVDAIERRLEQLESALLCMATHGRGRAVGSLVGSVARSLFERSREPIVAVGPFAERPPDFVSRKSPAPLPVPLAVARLVACVDGSPASEAVLPAAAAWAATLGMSLTILTVADPAFPPLDDGDTWRRRYGPDGDADAYVGGLVDRWTHDAREVTGEVVHDPIGPSSGVKAYLDAHPAGLLAVTTHARQGWRRLRFGAGAAGIVRVSDVPTLIVPLSG